MKRTDDTKSTEAPKLDAEHWYSGAVAFAALSLILTGFAAIQMVMSKSISEAKDIAAIYQPFFVAAAALVTFCTIAWRGIIGAQQLEAQKEANWSKDGENAAKLLQEGAKLLGEREKPSYVLAGVASLAALLTDKEIRFQVQAMDLLADFYLENYEFDYQERVIKAVGRALAQGVAAGYKSTVVGEFHARSTNGNGDTPTKWRPINGFASQIYHGGDIYPRSYVSIVEDSFVFFNGVRFIQCRIDDYNYSDCNFHDCTIQSISADVLVKSSFFVSNDFSGAEIHDSFGVHTADVDLRSGQNWYYADNPPRWGSFKDWKSILIERPFR